MNLLKETEQAIDESGHIPKNIIFIGSEETGHSCDWAEFRAFADLEYDAGFGGQEVAKDLVVVFSDGQKLWRGEYDGSEWWNFSKPFQMPIKTYPISKLISEDSWGSLEDINKEEEED